MVDYTTPQSVSTPPADILKIQILERRHYAIEAIKEYKKVEQKTGVTGDTNTWVIRSAVYSLFLELQGSLITNMKKEEYDELLKKSDSRKYDDLLTALNIMNEYLYKKKLTRFDSRSDIDSTDIEAVNREHGL